MFLWLQCGRGEWVTWKLMRGDGSALPILRQLGAQGGGSSLIKSAREGDFSMLKVWVGLEARKFLKASVDDVSAPGCSISQKMPDQLC